MGVMTAGIQPVVAEETQERCWPQLDPLALHGVLGEAVTTIAPLTEADEAALLFTLATLAGVSMGRSAHGLASAAEHPARLHIAIVGKTASGAKGQSWSACKGVFRHVDPTLMQERVLGGFGSGEAFIDELDPALGDERLVVFASELTQVLAVLARKGTTLEDALKDVWDDVGRISVRSRTKKSSAPSSHVGIVGHITPHGLAPALTDTQIHNGFANRFLWVLSQKSKRLPEGDALDEAVLVPVARELRTAISAARSRGRLQRTAEAKDLFAALYDEYEAQGDHHPVLARAAAHNLRLQVLYAALDGSKHIEAVHVEAANAAWRYCHDSALYLFEAGGAVEDTASVSLEEQDLAALSQAARDRHPEELLVRDQRRVISGKRGRNGAYLGKLRRELARRGDCRDENKSLVYIKGKGE